MTEAGPLDLLSGDEGEDSDDPGRGIKLPGVRKGGIFPAPLAALGFFC